MAPLASLVDHWVMLFHFSVCENVTVDVRDDFAYYVLAEVYPTAYCHSGKVSVPSTYSSHQPDNHLLPPEVDL